MLKPLYLLSGWVALVCLLGSAEAQSPAPKAELRNLIDLPERHQAPDFKLIDTQGKAHTLSDYRGKVVIVNFWATWCEPCRKEMPSLQRAWERLRAKDVVVLAVNWGEAAPTVEQFLKDAQVDFPVLLSVDDDMIARWSVKGLPTTFVIDPQGRLAYQVAGDLEWDDPRILDTVLALGNSR
jgi:peroxiredoxin